MRMRTSILSTALLFLMVGTANAVELPANDLFASGRQLDGRQITLKNCMINGANSDFVTCSTDSSNLTQGILLAGDSLDSVDLNYALKHCASWAAAQGCSADISGLVTSFNSYYVLSYSGINWKNPETQK